MNRKTALSLIIVLWTCSLYGGLLGHGFVGDDTASIVQNMALRETTPLSRFFLDPQTQSAGGKRANAEIYRPLTTLSEAVLFGAAGTNPAPYHLVSLLLHAATGCLLLLIVLSFDESRWPEALGAALIFVSHPVNVEAVAYATQLSTLASSFWLFVALLCSLQTASPIWFEASLAAALAASGFKESALMFPALAWLLGRLRKQLKPDEPRRVAQSPFFLLLSAAAGAAFFVWRGFILGRAAQQPPRTGSAPGEFLLMVKAFGCYLKLLIWPHPLSYYYLLKVPTGPLDPLVLLSAAAIAATVAAAWYFRRRKPEAVFAVAWLYLALLPVANILPTVSTMNERFLYIPCMGFCFLLPRLVGDALRRFKSLDPRWILAPLAPVLLAYAALVLNRLPDWKDNETMVLATLRTCPQAASVHEALALQYARFGRIDDAIREFTVSLAIDSTQMAILKEKNLIPPVSGEELRRWDDWGRTVHYGLDFLPLWSNLGAAYLVKRDYEHAAAALEQALLLSPGDADAKKNLDAARAAMTASAPKGGAAELKAMSIERLFAAAMRAPQPWQKRRYRLEIAERAPASPYGIFCAAWLRPDSQTEEKIKDFSAAIALKPDFWEAYVGRGTAYKFLNRLPEAVADYSAAAEHGLALGQYNMGILSLLGQGVPQDSAQAADWFKRGAAQEEPSSEVNLGVLYFKGAGVKKDFALAMKWFRKAAEQDSAPADDYLAVIYEQGLDEDGQRVPKDHSQALRWYRRAARLGDPQAERALAGFGEKP
ncbi:MAG: tetratricopeptide repeat protein [Elusimicrobiota bacterium]